MRLALLAPLVLCSATACAPEPHAPEAPARDPSPTGSAAEVAAPALSSPSQAATAGASAAASTTSEPSRPETDEEIAKRCAEQHPKPYPVLAAEDSDDPSDAHAQAILSSMASGGTAAGTAKVVSAMAPAFRRCFTRALACDPDMRGSARIAVKIDGEGHVASATPIRAKGLSTGVLDCLVGVVSSRTFEKPDGGSAAIVIPVVFVSAG